MEEEGRISKHSEKHWKREEKPPQRRKKSEVRPNSISDLEVAEIQKKGGTEREMEEEWEGRNRSWLPAVRNRRGKPSWTDDERFLQALTSFWTTSAFHPSQNRKIHFKKKKTQVNKDEGDTAIRIHTGWEMTARDIWTATEGSGFKAHCCRVSLGLQSKTSTPSLKD